MPRWLQILLHLTAVGSGAYVAAITGTPIPLVVTGGINTAIGAIAQSYNTDGTAQATAYRKPAATTTTATTITTKE